MDRWWFNNHSTEWHNCDVIVIHYAFCFVANNRALGGTRINDQPTRDKQTKIKEHFIPKPKKKSSVESHYWQ